MSDKRKIAAAIIILIIVLVGRSYFDDPEPKGIDFRLEFDVDSEDDFYQMNFSPGIWRINYTVSSNLHDIRIIVFLDEEKFEVSYDLTSTVRSIAYINSFDAPPFTSKIIFVGSLEIQFGFIEIRYFRK